jgi:Spy/CpxP family protein refolding chaperone
MRIAVAAVAVTLAFAAAPSASAQDEPGKTPAPEAKPEEGTQERRRDRGRNRDRMSRRWGRGMLDVERMKGELGLTDEQATQLEEINANIRKQMEELRKQFQDGTFDPSQMRERMRNGRQEIEGKIKSILTEEQAKTWEKSRAERMRGMRGRWGRDRGQQREELSKRLRTQALESLALDEEVAAVVVPLLDTVLETRKLILSEGERRRGEFTKKVKETSDPEALTKLLADFRSAQKADQEQLAAAQAQLHEILTLDQEAKLVGLNILD